METPQVILSAPLASPGALWGSRILATGSLPPLNHNVSWTTSNMHFLQQIPKVSDLSLFSFTVCVQQRNSIPYYFKPIFCSNLIHFIQTLSFHCYEFSSLFCFSVIYPKNSKVGDQWVSVVILRIFCILKEKQQLFDCCWLLFCRTETKLHL